MCIWMVYFWAGPPLSPVQKKILPSLIILTSIMLWLINITTTHYSIRIWIHCCNTYIKLLHHAVLVNISVINKIVLVTVVMAVHLCNLPMSPRSTNKKNNNILSSYEILKGNCYSIHILVIVYSILKHWTHFLLFK